MFHRILLLGGLLSLLACGSSTEPKPAIVGSYTLTTAAGAPLPFTQTVDDLTTRLLQETLVVNPNGTYTRSGTQQTVSGGTTVTQPYSVTGTYTYAGYGQYTFIDQVLGQGTATPSDGTLTVSITGVLFGFTPQ